MPNHVTAERKPASTAAHAVPARPASSTQRGAERQAPAFKSDGLSTLLPAGKTTAPQVSASVAADEIDLSKGNLAIPAEVADSVKEGGELDVKVRLPGLAQGELKLWRRAGHFSSIHEQGILLSHPALARFSAATQIWSAHRRYRRPAHPRPNFAPRGDLPPSRRDVTSASWETPSVQGRLSLLDGSPEGAALHRNFETRSYS